MKRNGSYERKQYTNGCVDSLWQTIQGLRSMSVPAGTLPAAADNEDARDEEDASS